MSSFILFGVKQLGGFRLVQKSDLQELPDGGLSHAGDNDLFLTPAGQQVLRQRGLSMGSPVWEHELNELVANSVLHDVAADSIAKELFIELGREERRASASLDVPTIARQRVREAALGFNLLATGSTWRPAIASGLPYWSRDWVAWCDKYIAEFKKSRTQYMQTRSLREARMLEIAEENLGMIRAAFASTRMTAATPQSSGGCYVATSIYGSYEAPEVLILRRWRDKNLARTATGRAFIRFYYAVSPALVRKVGNRRWFSIPTRKVLDTFTQHLTRRAERTTQ